MVRSHLLVAVAVATAGALALLVGPIAPGSWLQPVAALGLIAVIAVGYQGTAPRPGGATAGRGGPDQAGPIAASTASTHAASSSSPYTSR